MSSLWLCSLITSSLAACERVCLMYFTLSVSVKKKLGVYISVRRCVLGMTHLLQRRYYSHCSSSMFYKSILFIFRQLSSPLPLPSGFPYPLSLLSHSLALCLWLTSSVGDLAWWLPESDIWIYYCSTHQISSLRLSAVVAHPCPCVSFSELTGLMLPCAGCPNRLQLLCGGEKDSPDLSHAWSVGERMLVDLN